MRDSVVKPRAEIRNNPGARFLLVSASLVIVVAGLRAAGPILVPLLVAVMLSILSSPLLDGLVRMRLPKIIAVGITVLANLAVVMTLLLPVGGSLNTLTASLPKYQERLEEMANSTLDWLERHGIDTSELSWLQTVPLTEDEATGLFLPPPGEPVDPPLAPDPSQRRARGRSPETASGWLNVSSVFDLLTGTLKGLATIVSKTFLVFLIMIFILFEAAGLPRKLEATFGLGSDALDRLLQAKRDVQRYLGIKTLISLVTGTLVCLWVWLLEVDFPLLWGLVAFLLNYIPTIGSILASIPATLLTLIEGGPARALLVALGYLAVNLVLGNFVEPHLLGRRLGLSTLVVFLSLVFWGWLWGPVGMLLSVPLTMILKILLEYTEDFRWLAELLGRPPRTPA